MDRCFADRSRFVFRISLRPPIIGFFVEQYLLEYVPGNQADFRITDGRNRPTRKAIWRRASGRRQWMIFTFALSRVSNPPQLVRFFYIISMYWLLRMFAISELISCTGNCCIYSVKLCQNYMPSPDEAYCSWSFSVPFTDCFSTFGRFATPLWFRNVSCVLTPLIPRFFLALFMPLNAS